MQSLRQRHRQARAATPPAVSTSEGKLPDRPKRVRKPAEAKAVLPPSTAQVRPTTGIDTAPLRMFKLSDLNVRKFYRDDDVAEMARLIEAWGLQQNLVAVMDEDGQLAVTAGGRRLRALWLLQDEGKIGAEYEVPFQLSAPEDGRELSLMENASRIALNPVEEIEAYARIVADHHDKADPLTFAANRQGVTRAYVESMVRLGQLATEILDALRAGRIDIGAARAYATTTDVEVQLQVFHAEERRIHGTPHKAAEIRSALRGRSYPADGAEAVYVGLDAYRKAGGRAERELLLGADGGERLLDRALLERLARSKAEDEANVCAIEQGMSGGVLVLVFSQHASWPKPAPGYVNQPGVIGDRLDRLDPALRAAAIGVFNLKGDGSGLVLEGVMTPIAMPAADPAPVPPPAAAEAPADPTPAPAPVDALPTPRPPIAAALPTLPPGHQPAAEMEQLRARAIQRRAAVLVARELVTAAPQLRDHLVGAEDDPDDLVEVLPDGDVLVTIQLRVSADELDAQRATATAELDADDAGGGRGRLFAGEA